MRPPIYSDMLQNYYEAKFGRVNLRRRERLRALTSADEARAYVSEVADIAREALCHFPSERGPLRERVTHHEEYRGLVLESVIYESRPGFHVSARRFRPAGTAGQLPGILLLAGHAWCGKSNPPYQTVAMTLASMGAVVLSPDPVSQGERLQFWRTTGKAFGLSCCDEHNQLNKMLNLFGDNLAFWRLWDALRSLDALEADPQVDGGRLGVTGNSGGGTLSSYLWSVDDRLKACAPGCYITTFQRNFTNELPVDAEQAVPGLAAAGFEIADFLIARAPAPCLVLAKTNDFFDPRGTREACADLEKIYGLLGASDRFRWHFEEGEHGYTTGNCLAAARFFRETLGLEGEPVLVPHSAEVPDVPASPGGQVANIPGSRTLPELLEEQSRLITPVPSPADLRAYTAGIIGAPPLEDYDYKVLRNGTLPDGRTVSIYGIRTEPNILAFLHTADSKLHSTVPRINGEKAVLAVAERDAETEVQTVQSFPGERIFTLDVRGFGKSFPLTSDRDGTFETLYGTEYFYDATGLMLDDSLFAGRARDVAAALTVLKNAGYREVRVLGQGYAAIFTAFACAANPHLHKGFTPEKTPESLRELVRDAGFPHPQSFAPRGMLLHCDLPELFQLVAPDKKR